MLKINKKLLIVLCCFFIGCSSTGLKSPVVKDDFYNDKFYKHLAVERIEIENFLVVRDDLLLVPDFKIKIDLAEALPVFDFFKYLSVQKINIIYNSDLEKESDLTIALLSFSGTLRELLQALRHTYGFFYTYNDNVLVVKMTSPVFVKVLMPGMEKSIKDLLFAYGIPDSFYDFISGRVVFQTDYFRYKKIHDYFLNNSYLSLVTLDVLILETEVSESESQGVDWSKLSFLLTESLSSVVTAGSLKPAHDGFILQFADKNVSFDTVLKNIKKKMDFKVVHSARVSMLNGSDYVLDVSDKIPYVSEMSFASLSDRSENLSQNFKFANVSSGLVLNLQPFVNDNLIFLKCAAHMQTLVDFLKVGSGASTVSQPVISTRNIENNVLLVPGQVCLVGGLKYAKMINAKAGLSFLAGFASQEYRNFALTFLIRPELKQYIFI